MVEGSVEFVLNDCARETLVSLVLNHKFSE